MTRKDMEHGLRDAERSARLNNWELDFVESMMRRHPSYTLSEAQVQTWHKIEDKIYAAG
jgi:hypothetical protein